MRRAIAPVPGGAAGGLGSIGHAPLNLDGSASAAPAPPRPPSVHSLGHGLEGPNVSARSSTEPIMLSFRARSDGLKPPHRRMRVAGSKKLSIRFLFVLLSVVYIVVATCVTWAVTYVFALRNIREITAALLDEARESTVQSVTGYVTTAQTINLRTRSGFESGLLTQGAWRKTLEFMAASVGAAASSFPRSPPSPPPEPDVYHSNGTHFSYYAGPTGGSPSPSSCARLPRHPAPAPGPRESAPGRAQWSEPAPSTVSGMWREVAASAGLANWHDLVVLRLSVAARPAPAPAPPRRPSQARRTGAPSTASPSSAPRPPPRRPAPASDPEADRYGTGIRVRPPPEELGLPLPAGLPREAPARGRPRPTPPARWPPSPWPAPAPPRPARPSPALRGGRCRWAWGPLGVPAGDAAGAGRRRGRDDPAGAMVATSTGTPPTSSTPPSAPRAPPGPAPPPRRARGAQGQPVLASRSPSPLILALVGEGGGRAAPARGSFLTLAAEGWPYYYSRASVSLEPNLNWTIFLAVREEAVVAQISSSLTVISSANAAWLVVSVAGAVLAGLRVTRPLAELHAQLERVLETLVAMTRELRARLAEGAPGPGRRASLASTASLSDPDAPDPAGPAPEPPDRDAYRPGDESKPASELARFEPLLARVHARFSAFAGLLSARTRPASTRARAEAVSKFLSTMSHEMRTPLNGILGMLELASDLELPGEAAGYLAAASRCGEHLLFIVSDLLDFQRMESGALALRQVALDVREVLASALKMLEVQAEAKGVELRAEVEAGVPAALLSDPNRLRQVLLNLIGNALKVRRRPPPAASAAPAGPEAGRHRHALPERPTGAGAVVLRFEVADTGLGIPLEEQPLLFAPFFRARVEGGPDPAAPVPPRPAAPPRRGARGEAAAGLGLAICKELVQRAGGRLAPRRPRPNAAAAPAALPSPRGPAPVEEAAARRVLVVEGAPRAGPRGAPAAAEGGAGADDEVTQRVVAATLKRAGHAALAVELFGAAAEAAPRGARAFDCIFMDCSMPVLDGYRATEAIRGLEAARGLPRHPIVAFTAHGDADDEDLCRRAGMDLFLIKPVRRAALLAKAGGAPPHPPRAPLAGEALLEPPPPRGPSFPFPAPAPAPGAGPSAAEGREPAGEQTVLVVDDVEMNRRVLVGLARREGLPVETAGDGEEAVAAFAARAAAGRRFALILMDIQARPAPARPAPACSGELRLPAPTPIVACTAFSDRGASLEAGMQDHLQARPAPAPRPRPPWA
eukprot:tig00001057_g6696.t1